MEDKSDAELSEEYINLPAQCFLLNNMNIPPAETEKLILWIRDSAADCAATLFQPSQLTPCWHRSEKNRISAAWSKTI
jgi:hypothetical protein